MRKTTLLVELLLIQEKAIAHELKDEKTGICIMVPPEMCPELTQCFRDLFYDAVHPVEESMMGMPEVQATQFYNTHNQWTPGTEQFKMRLRLLEEVIALLSARGYHREYILR